MATSCPISGTKVDENVARLNGVSTIVLAILLHFHILFGILLIVDFILRILKIKYSPIARINKLIVTKLNITPKPIDFAPKRFAAMIGLMLSTIIVLLNLINLTFISVVLSLLLITAAGLEAFLNYCLGCELYSLLRKCNLD